MHKDKSPQAFRTISEAATEVGEEAHVLRFWERQIKELKPMKNHGQRRYYRPEDIMLLHSIRYFLRHRGYKIEGVQKLLRHNGVNKFIELYNNRNNNPADNMKAEHTIAEPDPLALDEQQLARLRILHQNMTHFRNRLTSLIETPTPAN